MFTCCIIILFCCFPGDEAQIQHFLEDLDQWKMHYSMLQTTSSLLMNACDENIASNLQQKMAVIHCNWSYLLQYAEKYGSDTLNRATFDEELKQLENWLTKASTSVSVIRKFNRSEVQEGLDEVIVLNDQVAKMETLFKSLSRRFQALVSEMAMPEIEDTMKILKRHKEQLVNVRSALPIKLADLTDASKDVETVEEQIMCLEKSLSNNQFSKNHTPVQDELKTIDIIRQSLTNYSEKGFNVIEADSEICYIRRQLAEIQAWHEKRDQMLKIRFESRCVELEALLESMHSNLLQMVITQLHLMILSKQHDTKDHLSKVQKQISDTLNYIKDAEEQNKTNVSDTDAKLCTELKILAQADMENLVTSITADDKDRIIRMIEILLNLTKECSHDIASTYSSLESLRNKIRAIPIVIPDPEIETLETENISEENNGEDDEEEEEEDEDELDNFQDETKAQLASNTTKVKISKVTK